MPFEVKKTYGHDLGLSACFRQWLAASHCRFVHGYALAFEITVACDTLDPRGWVMDFGAFKPLKQALVNTFDHKLLVAGDDPHLDELCQLGGIGVADPLVMPNGVGCEKFALYVYGLAQEALLADRTNALRGVRVVSVECREHGANSAIYYGE